MSDHEHDKEHKDEQHEEQEQPRVHEVPPNAPGPEMHIAPDAGLAGDGDTRDY